MTEILISKQCLVLEVFGHWILVRQFFGGFEFEFYLKFACPPAFWRGAWNLYFLKTIRQGIAIYL